MYSMVVCKLHKVAEIVKAFPKMQKLPILIMTLTSAVEVMLKYAPCMLTGAETKCSLQFLGICQI